MNDLRYACRLLRRDLGYAAVAILTMAVGIGATTTLFSVAYGVLLKPLPWAGGDRLVRLSSRMMAGRTSAVIASIADVTVTSEGASLPNIATARRPSRSWW